MKKIILLTISILLLVGCEATKEGIDNSKSKEVEYTNIIYREILDNKPVNACISFKKNNDYSMDDCNNNVSNYSFDNNAECTFKYDGEYIKFTCKKENGEAKIDIIKILQWDKYTFSFKYGDEEKLFKSLTWIEENLKEEESA